jgi:pimeloyl-ACP methyl ester carboxylesterase
MTTFALVHGAFCSASVWDLLRPELEARGHSVVTMDLPCDDPAAGSSAYADVVVEALAGHPAPVVVVGHSLAGLTIPLVAARRPVSRLVFLSAFIPQPGRPFSDQYGEEGMFPPGDERTGPVFHEGGMMTWPPERVIPGLFAPDVPPAIARPAAESLRPQSTTPHGEPCPLQAWPSCPSSYILCTEDTAVGAEWARQAARERLHTEAIELPGGHMSMLSRPAELARALEQAASG